MVCNSPHPTSISVATAIHQGEELIAAAGTAQPLAEDSTSIRSVTVKALATNGGDVYVGNVDVAAANGFPLAASESVSINIDDLSKVYVDAAVNGEGVRWIAVA